MLHALAALPLGKALLLPVEKETGGGLRGPVRTLFRKHK